ncbi:MAG: hypothetical protein U0Q22_00700 [Acidimicrobiales bacterium]
MTAVVMIEAVVIAGLCLLVLGLLRSHAEILRALHDLGVNLDGEGSGDQTFRVRERTSPAPPAPAAVDVRDTPGRVEAIRPTDGPEHLGDAHDVAGQTATGEAAIIGVVDSDRPTLLAFLSTGCVTCQDFWEAFAAGVDLELDGRAVRIVAVTKGAEHESPGMIETLAGPTFTTVMSDEAYDEYGVPVSPYFVLVDAHSSDILGEGASQSWTQLASLLDRAVADRRGTFGANRTRRELLGG